MRIKSMLAIIAAFALGATDVLAETVTCPVSRDVWLSSTHHEKTYNMGAADTIKLKINQEFGILDFDVKKLKGKTIKNAWLYVKIADKGKWGLNGGTDLRRISLATVGKDWVEGKSNRYAVDTKGFGASYTESSTGKANWGWPGAVMFEVSLGNSNTLRGETEIIPAKDKKGWYKMNVDTRLVKAMVSGATHGLTILDGTTDVSMNPRIYAKESGQHAPYLVVTTSGFDKKAPTAPTTLSIQANETWATDNQGAIELSLIAPKDAYSLDIKLNGKHIDRWQIPFVNKGGKMAFPIRYLKANSPVTVEVASVDAAGNRSSYTRAKGKVSAPITVPTLPTSPFTPKAGAPPTLADAIIFAYPEITKISPFNGKVLHESIPDVEKANAVWDGASHTVRLAAARGEIISFQVGVKGKLGKTSVSPGSLRGPGVISKNGARVFWNWHIKEHAAYAIPLEGTFENPMPINKLKGQTFQSLTVDYHVPLNTKAGDYHGALTLTHHKTSIKLNVNVKVYNTVIPETVFFNPELNCYNGPGQAGSEKYKDSFRLAHYHRATINRVPYSQSGRTHGDYAPAVDPNGKIKSFAQFDKNLGGLLDGSWFRDNPRAGVPVPTFYLPFYEGYPLDYRKHYNPGSKAIKTWSNKNDATRHHIVAAPLEKAMSTRYQKAFKQAVRDFYKHAQKKGWNKTMFQMYQNNKSWKGGYAAWTLDEPYKAVDWDALNFWGQLFKEGTGDTSVYEAPFFEEYFNKGGFGAMRRRKPMFFYRGDISRLRQQGSMSDGIMNMVYGGGGKSIHREIFKRGPAIMYTYGGTPSETSSHWGSAAWCYKTYTDYQDGVLPWQSLGTEQNMWQGDTVGNALIVDASKLGLPHAIASLRIHGLRRGAQDVELFRLLQLKNGWAREHIERLVSQSVAFKANHAVTDAASAVKFGKLNARSFMAAKEGVLQLLDR